MIDSRLFISYSSQDKRFVVRLAKNLQAQGFEVWYDGWEIAVGDSIIEKVFAGIQASDGITALMSGC